ncbi:hypothetical protein [Caldisericum exile]|uniref:Uncharacterized protein n=1 Tax=Caldisericum exile (strain DSM 21853 / NBRC 104410 / AZM16c01) TaxID=511051 RepID=A0A7U6GFX1_CALEA|nr:hypothetical protein [Caldisericum exile]BAL81669.1 hypothetical protein CSE_15430 [Caldisericum exile AZM16c01]
MAVGRFQVMATLQAARAYVLGKPIHEAKSFGLNRAIFYAAAKKGFKAMKGAKPPEKVVIGKTELPEDKIKKIQESFKVENIGDEIAYAVTLDGKTYYIIGNEIQTEEDFAKEIERRFNGKFDKAWEEALMIVSSYDKGVLLSQRYFYEVVYKPRRDELAKKWTALAEGEDLENNG